MQVFYLSISGLIAANVIAWLTIHVCLSYFCLKVPDSFYESRNLDHRMKKREASLYDKMKIRSWKTVLPDGGGVFKGGFRKKELNTLTVTYVSKFIIETRRAEFNHWILIPPSLLFFLWNPPLVGWIMVAYSLVVNIPFIMIQRYNRFRLELILPKLKKKEQRRRSSVETYGT
ncbi:glycosyl-4,4'-diaponeurosporenoate acyltransferase [Guptibacillus algicola]|uniref:glycosyl-4,4'-diaponeurosporenoate acyltransferase CrtO family protein n=1 Tax=Guptibacillus algicola TaxID=225844 RepID=UPI001CD75037|nr:glycosyl-4,4'-diaponeurosporenoate acyltransferase [Alkalihalobacillus algicola]MCA0988255.1 glycosyl-4,4'-diaponeurosporenoate acyltransferase [Alkalihalobacillus algicola]